MLLSRRCPVGDGGRPVRWGGRGLSTLVVVLGSYLYGVVPALADPGLTDGAIPGPAEVAAEPVSGAPESIACQQFSSAERFASAYYNTFAYSIAGNGAHVDYGDPTINSNNTDGRTALRKAAGTALSASALPSVPADIANPMRSWSWHAAKLAIAMGVRGDGDTLNAAAGELNSAAEDVKLGCAAFGIRLAPGIPG